MGVMAIMMGGHARVGLEDNIFVRRKVLATNVDLVEKFKRIAAEFEREIASPDEARKMLGLKGRDAVNFYMTTGIVQIAGGLLIIVGVVGQLAALILALNMLVATYVSIWKHRESFLSTPDGKGWDINFLLIGAFVALMFLGA